jgi:carbon-monoxide dehydrogenase large subunit
MTRKAPLAMEPRSYAAEYEKSRDAITLYTSSNIPGIVRDAISESLGLPGHRLRVVAPDVGGSFGSKGSLYPEELLICIAARKLRRSVKWTADRLEDVSSSSQAFGEIVDAEMGFDANGIATSLQADVIGDVGAYSIYPWTCGLEPVQVVSFLPGPYKIRSYRGAVRGVATCKPPTGPYRGVGRPISTFVAERLMDLGAKALGIDPLEIRRRNLVRSEEFPYRIASGIIWDKTGFVECLDAAAEAAGYEQLRKEQAEAREQGRLFGIGIATYAELTGIGSRIAVAPGMPINTGSETAKITIDSTGAITAAFGVASHGQGLETTLAQIVADDLGARFEDVRVIQGDSDEVPMSTGTYASRSAVLGGGAAKHASKILQEKIKRVASHLLEANAADIKVTEGMATVLGTDRAVSFKQIAKAVYADMKTLPVEAREELSATYTYDPINGTTAAATHIAAVEVDPVSCFVRILKFVVAEDCGRIINPMIVDGQVHGGVAQGIGAALLEELIYDEDGQLLTASLVDYMIPSAPDVPLMDVVHIESESAVAGGFRGMGEGGTIGAPAAIANAIADALSPLDIDVSILPMTPERIFKLMEQAKLKSRGKVDE